MKRKALNHYVPGTMPQAIVDVANYQAKTIENFAKQWDPELKKQGLALARAVRKEGRERAKMVKEILAKNQA